MSDFGIRIHGRGGQGVVTMAALLATVAFDSGYEAQAFPSFGSERMGAPVTSYCRIARTPIWVRDPVGAPDAVIVCDPTLPHRVDVFAGLAADGTVLLNSSKPVGESGLAELVSGRRLLTVPATELARQHTGRTIPNSPLLGAFAAATGLIPIEAVEAAIGRWFAGRLGDGNVRAARAGYDAVSNDLLRKAVGADA